MLWTHALNTFAEQLNELELDDCGVTPMVIFSATTIDINLNNHHTWGCQIYVLDARLNETIGGLPK